MFRINPVYRKELKISVRSMKMAMIIFGYNAFLAFIGLLTFYFTFHTVNIYQSVDYGEILTIYKTIAILEFALILFVVPAFTATAIAGERERQTLEILLTTKLKPRQIVLGKLEASISTILLLVISSMPIMAIVFTVGGVGLVDIMQYILLIFVTAIFVGSIGIFFSSLFKRTTAATVFTYGMTIVLILGTIIGVAAIYLLVSRWNEAQYYQNGMTTWIDTDLGNITLVFLVNPVLTLTQMLTRQFGGDYTMRSIMGNYGNCSPFFIDHWYICSIVVQLLCSALLLFLAVKLLQPKKSHKKSRRKSQEKRHKKDKVIKNETIQSEAIQNETVSNTAAQ